jgi:hypothetical protein
MAATNPTTVAYPGYNYGTYGAMPDKQ